jgi:hypothetical protein
MRGLKAIALIVASGLITLEVLGCGGGGATSNGGGNNTPTAVSTTPSSTKTAMAVGDTAQGSCTVTMSDGTTNSNCTLSSGNTAVFTVDSTGKITAVGDGTANLVSTSTANTSAGKPATGQLSITVSSAVTSVTVSANPATITMAQTSTITVTAAGTGDFNPAVNLTASGGAISNASLNGDVTTATFTPSGTGTATITAISKQDGTKSGSAQVTIVRAAPVITSFTTIGQNWFWCVNDCNKSTISLQVQGIGAQAGDYLNFHGYWPTVSLSASNFSADGKTITVQENINDANQPSGNWIYVDVDPADGTPASNTMAIAYLNFANSGTFGPSGEVIQRSNTSPTAYLWQLKNGAWSSAGPIPVGGGAVTAYDVDGTNQYLVDANATYTLTGTLVSAANMPGDQPSSGDAFGNLACVVQPVYGHVSIFNPGIVGEQPFLGQTGATPYDCKVVVINSTPYVFAISVGSSSVLWKFDANGNSVGSQALTGITSASDIAAANHMEGNWQLSVIKTGTNAGFLAVLSTYDDALDIYDGTQNSMPLVKEVSLAPSCVLPQAVTAIDAMNQFRVACLVNDGSNPHTSFVGVDLSGNVTPLAATSAKFPQGFVADQNNLYVLYGSGAPDSPANQ